jgi:hypothetical protein
VSAFAASEIAYPLSGLLLLSCLGACNAMLGIDAPEQAPLSEVSEKPGHGLRDAGSAPSAPGAGDGDAQVDEEEDPPSPYAWAAWPMPNPVTGSGAGNTQIFETRERGVVIDSTTALSWQQSVRAQPRSRDEAEAYCAELELAGGGFRLPSRIELLSLIDFTQSTTYLDPKAFPDAPHVKYWTSSRYAKSQNEGWVINFGFSTTFASIAEADAKHLVRCVRSREDSP